MCSNDTLASFFRWLLYFTLVLLHDHQLTPLMVAILARNDKVAMLLIQRSKVFCLFFFHWKRIDFATGTVAQLDAMDRAQRTALTYAIYFGQFKVADALVEKGITSRCCTA